MNITHYMVDSDAVGDLRVMLFSSPTSAFAAPLPTQAEVLAGILDDRPLIRQVIDLITPDKLPSEALRAIMADASPGMDGEAAAYVAGVPLTDLLSGATTFSYMVDEDPDTLDGPFRIMDGRFTRDVTRTQKGVPTTSLDVYVSYDNGNFELINVAPQLIKSTFRASMSLYAAGAAYINNRWPDAGLEADGCEDKQLEILVMAVGDVIEKEGVGVLDECPGIALRGVNYYRKWGEPVRLGNQRLASKHALDVVGGICDGHLTMLPYLPGQTIKAITAVATEELYQAGVEVVRSIIPHYDPSPWETVTAGDLNSGVGIIVLLGYLKKNNRLDEVNLPSSVWILMATSRHEHKTVG